jgi:molybdate transport system substrate-binding protein
MRPACLVPLFLCLAACAKEATPEPVTVCAASSLREITMEIGDAWGRAQNRTVEYRFESSDALARQIKEGATADIFLSADPERIAETKPIDSFPWIGNRLVCVRLRGAKVDDLAGAKSLALGSRGSPIGRHSQTALKALGITPPAETIYGNNVRDVLSKVAEGAAEAGIVYVTDVAVDPRVETAFELPAAAQPKVVYPVALLTERGRGLFDAFRAPAALEVARRSGFTGPP